MLPNSRHAMEGTFFRVEFIMQIVDESRLPSYIELLCALLEVYSYKEASMLNLNQPNQNIMKISKI